MLQEEPAAGNVAFIYGGVLLEMVQTMVLNLLILSEPSQLKNIILMKFFTSVQWP